MALLQKRPVILRSTSVCERFLEHTMCRASGSTLSDFKLERCPISKKVEKVRENPKFHIEVVPQNDEIYEILSHIWGGYN